MTDDLLQRLRNWASCTAGVGRHCMLDAISEIERLRADVREQARLNGKGGERELALMARAETAERVRDALRARIEGAPVAFIHANNRVTSFRSSIGIDGMVSDGKRVRLVVEP